MNELPSVGSRPARWPPIPVIVFLLIALAPILHWGAWNFEFVNYDDPDYVTSNPKVLQGLSLEGIAWAFQTMHAANWHPLTWISHMIDVSLFGDWAGGHHLSSLFLHGVNAAMLFLFVLVCTRRHWESLLVASLFLVHPLHVESVLWIAERKDVLSATFALASLLAYSYGLRQGDRRWRFAAFALVLLGMLAKPMLVTLPFVFLLLDTWPLQRPEKLRALLVEKLPLFVGVAALAAVTVVAQRGGESVSGLDLLDAPQRLSNAIVSYPRYVGKFLWPQPLAVFYPHPALTGDRTGWSAGIVLLSGLVCGALLALMVWRRREAVGVGLAWFFGMLVPVIGLVQVGAQSMADRYMYLPAIGLMLAITFALGSRFRLLLLVALVGLAGRAHLQGEVWRNSETLFQHATQVTRDNWIAWGNLGVALRGQGRAEEALMAYDRALLAQESYASAHFNRGNALMDLKRPAEAEESFRRALELEADYSKAMNNLARCLLSLRRPEEAIPWLRRALELEPTNAGVCLNLAQALAGIERPDEALRVLREHHQIFAETSETIRRRAAQLHRRLEAGE